MSDERTSWTVTIQENEGDVILPATTVIKVDPDAEPTDVPSIMMRSGAELERDQIVTWLRDPEVWQRIMRRMQTPEPTATQIHALQDGLLAAAELLEGGNHWP